MIVSRKTLVRSMFQAALFMEYHFYFKRQLTDKLWLFRLEYFTDIFQKMNESKQVTSRKTIKWYLSPMMKFKYSSKNYKLKNNLYLPP